MGTLQYVLKVKPSRHSSVGRASHTLRQWQHNRFWFQALPMPACRYMEENGSATMLAAMRSAGDTLELSLMQCVTYMPLPSANNAAHSGFEAQWRRHQKSKKGPHSGPTERTYVLQKLYKNSIHVSFSFANCYTFNNMTQAKLPVPMCTTLLKHSVTVHGLFESICRSRAVSLSLFAGPGRILRRFSIFVEEPRKSIITTTEPCNPVFKEAQSRPSKHY